jgi:hypothetical protein
MSAQGHSGDRWRPYWDKHSASYDKQMGFFDESRDRAFICSALADMGALTRICPEPDEARLDRSC